MVTNTTIYTRQIYCVLHDDPPPADIEFHNGDELFIIDQDTRMIFDEENQTWRQIPMGGGGGGGTLITKTITANGTYNASDDNADGYSSVTVNVPGVSAPYKVSSGTVTPASAGNLVMPTGDISIIISMYCYMSNYSGYSGTTGKTLGAALLYPNAIINVGATSTKLLLSGKSGGGYDYFTSGVTFTFSSGTLTVTKSGYATVAGETYNYIIVGV